MIKKLLFFASFFLILIINAQTGPDAMVAKMGRGINLGNVFSAPVEGNWSPVVYQQYFIDVAAAGFTNVRIPIDFLSSSRTTGDTSIYSAAAGTSASYTGTSADYVINSTFLDRIEQVVTWGLNEGLVVIIDFHGGDLKKYFIKTFDSGQTAYYTDPTSARRAADNEKFRTVWSSIADRFKNYSENLLFEVINEPYFHMEEADMNTLNTDIIAIIRGSGGNNATRNIIITGGTLTSHQAPLAIDTAILASDNYLIPTFHYYQPFKFTSCTNNANPDSDWGTAADKAIVDADFAEVKTWATTNNVPIFMGEFSADNTFGYDYSTGDLKVITGANNPTGFAKTGPDNASRVEFHRYLAETAIVTNGFAFAAWDSGPKSNKTVHMRRDAGSTNYDINNFSVTSYDPKITTVSTTLDTSTWIEDIKEALLGTTTTCDNSIPNLIVNKNFECGYNDNWEMFLASGVGSASATFSDAGISNSKTGNVAAQINVTTAGSSINKIVFRNQEYTEDLTGKVITISGYAKGSTTGQNIKIRVKAVINGGNNFPGTSNINIGTSYPATPYEFEYTILPNTTLLQVQILCGQDVGIYYFDDFDFTINDAPSLGIDDLSLDSEIKVYPNPTRNILYLESKKDIKSIQIFTVLGKLVYKDFNYANSKIDVSSLTNGIYFLKITLKDESISTRKIILNN